MLGVSASEPKFHLSEPATIIDQFRSFQSQILMKKEDCDRIEAAIVKDLMPLLRQTFGNSCHYCTFGSMRTGLAMVGSDVDFHIDTGAVGNCYGTTLLNFECKRKVDACSKTLNSSDKFTLSRSVLDARVPLVIALHIPTKTKCDISFSGCIGEEHSKLLSFYFNLNPRFLEVMQVIKFWAKTNKICDGREYVSSYGWNLLFIGYLQTLKSDHGTSLVPSVNQMQPENCLSKKVVQNCRVDFQPAYRFVQLPDRSEYSHLGLLKGFFTFYRQFNFSQNVLCPYLGMTVSRRDSSPLLGSYQVMEHISRIRSQTSKGTAARFIRIIQDPFNHESFLCCRTFNLPTVTRCITKAADVCDVAMKKMPGEKSRFLETLFSQVK